MTDAERQRLLRILGMLGSSFAGERDNAARHAEAIGRRHGLTWEDLLALKSEKEAPQPVREPEPEPEAPQPATEPESPLWHVLQMPDRGSAWLLGSFAICFLLVALMSRSPPPRTVAENPPASLVPH